MKNREVAVELCFHVRETMCAVVPFLEKGQVLFMKQITTRPLDKTIKHQIFAGSNRQRNNQTFEPE